jgi:hypothetical protein
VARTLGRYDEVRVATLRHGATNVALQLLHRQEAADADRAVRAGFARDLLAGVLDGPAAERRAAALGWLPDTEYRVAMLHGPSVGGALEEQVRTLLGGGIVTTHEGRSLAIVPTSEVDGLAGIHRNVRMGLSTVHDDMAELPQACTEASEALAVATMFNGGHRIRRFEDLGLLALLTDVPRSDLEVFMHRTLGPLDLVSPGPRQALVDTLEALVATGLNVAEAARRGGWHYNTVRSRVTRLTRLLGPIIEDGARFDAVALSLVLRRELND